MIRGVDSSFARPSDAIVADEIAAGTKLWSGYIATKQGVGLAAAWPLSDFSEAKKLGSPPIAYCSGFDDPVALRALAAQWGVRLCLDVEGGIRGDGAWVQSFLDASGAGLYGNSPVFAGRRAAFYIEAAYPGSDPGVSWPTNQPRPSGPCGWQWEGTHTEFGDSVDRGNFDDWFATPLNSSQEGVTVQFQGTTKVLHDAFINKSGHLAHRWRDVSNSDSWHTEDLGAPPNVTLSEASIAMDAAVSVQVVRAVGSDGHVWVRYAVIPGTGWGGWVTDPEADADGGEQTAAGITLAEAQQAAHDEVAKALNAASQAI